MDIIKNTYTLPATQQFLANKLARKELKIFYKDGRINESFVEATIYPEGTNSSLLNYSDMIMGCNCLYYHMVGTGPDDWVFAPSMVDIPFYLNNELVSIVLEEHDNYKTYALRSLDATCKTSKWDEYQDMEDTLTA